MNSFTGKKLARAWAKQQRNNVLPDFVVQASARIRKHLQQWLLSHSQFDEARIFLFAALSGEPDVLPLASELPQRNFALPVVLNREQMEFRQFVAGDQLKTSPPLGIREPLAHAHILEPRAGDLILVPALALTEDGERLGHGAGYYDRYLEHTAAGSIKIGVTFSDSLLPRGAWPKAPHDAPMQGLLTDRGLTWLVVPSKR